MSLFFENLSESITNSFKKIKNKNKISKEDIDLIFKEIKLSLLEADVNYFVVKAFLRNMKQKVEDIQSWENISPEKQLIKITYEEIKKLLGDKQENLKDDNNKNRIILIAGLQGSGKTTFSVKLANFLKNKKNRNPLLVASDIYRPAAIEQLKILGNKINVDVFEKGKIDPIKIVEESLKLRNNYTDMIIDTAGRLHVDEKLMQELDKIKEISKPSEILLVIDSMTGQDAINTSIEFHDRLGVTGLVLSKTDGDTRGGVALTAKTMVGVPIKFISYSEKVDGIDIFYPDRMADRILGKGDILHLVDKISYTFKDTDLDNMTNKLFSKDYNLEDFLQQLKEVKKMGPLDNILKLIPGMNNNIINKIDNEKNQNEIKITETVINSMTKKERLKPNILNASRKKRISSGSGVSVQSVNKTLKQFNKFKEMAKSMNSMFDGTNMGNLNLDNFNINDMFNMFNKNKKSKNRHRNKFPF